MPLFYPYLIISPPYLAIFRGLSFYVSQLLASMSDISCEEESARESDDASETGSRSHSPGIHLCPRHSPPF